MNQQIAVFLGAQPHLTSAEFDRLFLEHYERIVTIAYHLIGDSDEAEDLALETFLKLWQDPPNKAVNLAGWLYRVVTNLGYNHLRSSRRRAGYEESALRMDLTLEDSDKPEEQVVLNQEREAVRLVLKSMSRHDVQILILRAHGLSYKEIADSLRVSPGSIGTMLVRAENKFELLIKRGGNDASER
jgi:RNA polymerase sigma factor (sigma-70 family)